MRKIYILAISFFCFFTASYGQTNIANYTLTTSNSAYTAISGGTVVASGTYDNQISAAVPLGGTFTYGGTDYTTCYISANGFVAFGAAPTGTTYTPMSTLGATTGAISAFGQDAGGSEVAGATPEISYLNIGGATGEFVVQYKDHANYYNRSQERLNFQIRLNLSSGAITIRYGSCTNPGTVSTSGTVVQVGIRGNSTTYATNVNNLMAGNVLPGTTCNWSDAVTGFANTSSFLFSGTTNVNVNIPNGLTFAWTPATAVAPVRVFSAVSGISLTSATVSWTAPTGAAQYNVQYRTPGTCTWTNFSGNPVTGTSANLTGLTSSTVYQVRVQAFNGATSAIYSHIPNQAGSGDGYTASGTFSTLCSATGIPYIQDFESATVPAIPGCTTIETISGNPLTVQTNPGSGFTSKTLRYNFNTAQAANSWFYTQGLTLTGGVSYRVSYRYGNNSTLYVERLKVAYGNNANSASMTSTIFDHPSVTGGLPATKVVDFIPATTGTYYIGFQAYSIADQFYLFVDDISVTLTPTCEGPTNLGISSVTAISAAVTWTASTSNPANGYQWEVRTSGAGGSGAAGLAANGTTLAGITTANATGLTASTAYNLYVRADCGGGDLSPWVGGFAFTTPCNVTVIPYTQDFESAVVPALPSCTSIETISGNPWTVQAAPGSGFTTKALRYNYNSAAAANAWFYTQGLILTGGVTYRLTYRYGNNSTFYVERMKVAYGTSPSSVSMTTTLADHPSVTGGVPATNTVDFTPAISGGYYIGFQAYSILDQFYLFVDDISVIVKPACEAPTNLGVSALTPISATAGWTASTSSPANGYEWEVRTSGAGGSGAVGLTTSGTTLAGITTANVTGLTANTAYTLWVRSNCGLANFSSWAGGFAFNTPCNAIAAFPFTETFEAASLTRSCWVPTLVTGTANWTYGAGAGNGGNITTAHGGTVNARHFGFGTGSVARLVSPALNFSAMPAQGAQVTFWYANQNWAGDQNDLRVYYKTSLAGAWTLIPGAVYNTDVGVWTEVELALPASSGPADYYIAFEGTELFGWGVAVDDVTVAVAPTCPRPTAVSATAILPTAVAVSFTSPGGAFIVEYGAPGFTPGTDNTPGVGGTLVFGPASPITVNGLTANTNYDFYVRRICIPGVDYSLNAKTTATTLCAAVNVPYTQDFDAVTPPAIPTCTSIQDLNGAPTWATVTAPAAWGFEGNSLRYLYDVAKPANDWFFIQGLNLTAGTLYEVSFKYGSTDPLYPERLKVAFGTSATSTAMVNTIADFPNIIAIAGPPFANRVRYSFTPATTGITYLGFQAYSLADEFQLFLDSIRVKAVPLVDVGVTSLTLPALNCPATGVVLQATIRNYNLIPVNFATYPVTVTANITGAATGAPSFVINTGTLAPGATMTVNLGPAFNFTTSGLYNIAAATSSVNDPETANDGLNRIFFVNPSPATPVITPATPQICIGTPVQLTTQFTASPAAVTLPAVSSGTIAVAIPDNSPAGVSHSLTVAGVPAGNFVTGISVTLNMTHTYISDMIISLKAPNGNVLNLFNQRGDDGDNLLNTVITSAAGGAYLSQGLAPFTGTWAADYNANNAPTAFPQTVNTFAGLSSIGNGVWTLALRDNAGLDVGTLTSWSITITHQAVTPVITWAPVTSLFTNAAATAAYPAGSNAFSIYANPAATTTYTITATSLAGCTSTATSTVTVNPYPVITPGSIPDTVCISDQSVTLLASPPGGVWSGPGVFGNNFLPPTTAVGTFTLSYTFASAAGCTTVATKRIAVKDCPERLILLRNNAVILYPNPNNGKFNIRINSALYNTLGMKVYTNSGTLVRNQQFTGLAWSRIVPIDLSNLPAGSYMVKFFYEGGPRTSEKTFNVVIGH